MAGVLVGDVPEGDVADVGDTPEGDVPESEFGEVGVPEVLVFVLGVVV